MPMRCAKNRNDWAHTTRDYALWFIQVKVAWNYFEPPYELHYELTKFIKRMPLKAVRHISPRPPNVDRSPRLFRVWLKSWPKGPPNSSQLDPSSQLQWSWVAFGHPLGLRWASWLEFDQAQIFAQLEPSCFVVVVWLRCRIQTIERFLAKWLDLAVSFGHRPMQLLDFVTWLELACVWSTVLPGLYAVVTAP